MDISNMFAPFRAEIAAGGGLQALESSYKDALAADGIVFPDNELTRRMRQRDQYAAWQRDAVELNPDGSAVDMTDFDANVVRAHLRANRLAVANSDRLVLLTDLALTSKAGSLAIARQIQLETAAGLYVPGLEDLEDLAQDLPPDDAADDPERPQSYVSALQHMNMLFKHYVQIALRTEEWEQPWQDLVADDFEGAALAFPLDVEGVSHANRVLWLEPFDALRHSKFPRLFSLNFNILWHMNDGQTATDHDEEYAKLVASVGLFYRHSPRGADDAIQMLINDGRLPADVDWHHQMHAAVAAVGDHSLED